MMSGTSLPAPERMGVLWWRATLDILPLSISVIPWGILCGALALQAGLSPVQAQLMSLLVYAGAAQLSATTLFGAGTPLLPIMGSTMVITSQHLLYGFTFRRDVLPLSLRWRASLAFFLTDEMFAVALKDRERSGVSTRLCPDRGIRVLPVLEPGDPARHRRRPVHRGAGLCHRRHLHRHDDPRHEEPAHGGGDCGERRHNTAHQAAAGEIHIIISALAGMVVGYVLHRMRR